MDPFVISAMVGATRCHSYNLLLTGTYQAVWNHCYLLFEEEGLRETEFGVALDDADEDVRLEVKLSILHDDMVGAISWGNVLLDVRDAVRATWRLGLNKLPEIGTWQNPVRYTSDQWQAIVIGTARFAMAQERRRVLAVGRRWRAWAQARGLLRRCIRHWAEVAMRPGGRLYLLYKRRFEANVRG